jgi:hypothetical protein
MFAALSAPEVLGLIFAVAVYVIVEIYLFWGACALADLELPAWSISFAIVIPLVALRGVVSYLLTKPFPIESVSYDNVQLSSVMAEVFSGTYWIRYGILSAVTWVLLAGVFAIFGPRKILRGMYAAGAFLVLEVIVSTLVLGIVLVVLAFMQIGTKSPDSKPASQVAPVTHRA